MRMRNAPQNQVYMRKWEQCPVAIGSRAWVMKFWNEHLMDVAGGYRLKPGRFVLTAYSYRLSVGTLARMIKKLPPLP